MIKLIVNKHNPIDTKLTTNCHYKYFIGWQRYTHDGGNTGKRGPNSGKAFWEFTYFWNNLEWRGISASGDWWMYCMNLSGWMYVLENIKKKWHHAIKPTVMYMVILIASYILITCTLVNFSQASVLNVLLYNSVYNILTLFFYM